jgi:hypothetical protein
VLSFSSGQHGWWSRSPPVTGPAYRPGRRDPAVPGDPLDRRCATRTTGDDRRTGTVRTGSVDAAPRGVVGGVTTCRCVYPAGNRGTTAVRRSAAAPPAAGGDRQCGRDARRRWSTWTVARGATGSGVTPVLGGAGTTVTSTVDVPPEDAVVVDHRTTEPAELSADVWRT